MSELLLFGVPYTVTLTAAPWIQRSRFKWVSSLYNKFKPLFDAYMGPYKDRYRYWTGMLLYTSESGSDSPVLQYCQHKHSCWDWSPTESPFAYPLVLCTNRSHCSPQTIQEEATKWTRDILPHNPVHLLLLKSLCLTHWNWKWATCLHLHSPCGDEFPRVSGNLPVPRVVQSTEGSERKEARAATRERGRGGVSSAGLAESQDPS